MCLECITLDIFRAATVIIIFLTHIIEAQHGHDFRNRKTK